MAEIYPKFENSQDSTLFNLPAGRAGGVVAKGERSEDLPCLYSNNSIETDSTKGQETSKNLAALLQPYHKKQAHILAENVYRLIEYCAGLEHVGFFTQTFIDNVTDSKEAYRRFHSYNNNWLSKHPEFGIWLCVKERQYRGAIHFHLLIQVKGDIRTGLDWEALKNRDYKTASPYLKKLWKDLREANPKYGFGRSELLPIKSNAQAMAYYVGKYISKDLTNKTDQDKGMRKVTYSRDWPKSSVKMAWFNDNSKLWRWCVKNFAILHGCEDLYQLAELLGPRWAYRNTEDIYNAPFTLRETGQTLPAYQDKKIKEIEDRKEVREKQEKKNLNIVVHKSQLQKQREDSRNLVALYKLLYERDRNLKGEVPF